MKIEFIKTQKVLSPTNITLADYAINPYRGCEFGCRYCYAQKNKNIKKTEFAAMLGVKINAPQVLEKELRYSSPQRVLLGSTTECFPYCESEYRITQRILEILNQHSIPYTILSKSHLIKNYLPLISAGRRNKIYFTFNCSSDKIIRFLERKSPSTAQRIDTIHQIMQANIALRVHIGPFFPHLFSLESVLKCIPKNVQEIDIELYHHTMGSFNDILSAVETNLGRDIKNKLQQTYGSKDAYQKFAAQLKNTIIGLRKTRNAAFYYIVPDYDKFYDSAINYETTVL